MRNSSDTALLEVLTETPSLSAHQLASHRPETRAARIQSAQPLSPSEGGTTRRQPRTSVVSRFLSPGQLTANSLIGSGNDPAGEAGSQQDGGELDPGAPLAANPPEAAHGPGLVHLDPLVIDRAAVGTGNGPLSDSLEILATRAMLMRTDEEHRRVLNGLVALRAMVQGMIDSHNAQQPAAQPDQQPDPDQQPGPAAPPEDHSQE